VRTGRILMAL